MKEHSREGWKASTKGLTSEDENPFETLKDFTTASKHSQKNQHQHRHNKTLETEFDYEGSDDEDLPIVSTDEDLRCEQTEDPIGEGEVDQLAQDALWLFEGTEFHAWFEEYDQFVDKEDEKGELSGEDYELTSSQVYTLTTTLHCTRTSHTYSHSEHITYMLLHCIRRSRRRRHLVFRVRVHYTFICRHS